MPYVINEDDYNQAIEIIKAARQASVSLLQRRMRIGYTKAAAIIDTMEERGAIGKYDGSKPREVLIKPEDKTAPLEKPVKATRGSSKVSTSKTKGKAEKKSTEKKQKPKKKTGRTGAWETAGMDSKLEAVRGWATQGATIKEIAAILGVSEATVYKWQAQKPEFKEALRAGRHISDGELIAAAFKQCVGGVVSIRKAMKVKEWELLKDKDKPDDPGTWKQVDRVKVVEVDAYIEPNAQMTMFMLANRLPKLYKKQQVIEHNQPGTEFDHMSDEEIEKEIAALEAQSREKKAKGRKAE